MNVKLIGCGGVGFWVGVSLAKAGIEFTTFDADDLQGGLGYTRLPKASLTTKKTALLRGHILTVWGGKPITVVDGLFTGNEVSEGDLVVDCSDMPLAVRKPIWSLCKERGARCLRISYDGLKNTVAVAEGLPLRSRANGAGGYSSVPGLDLSFVAGGIGAIAVRKILAGHKDHIEFQVSIDELLEPVVVPVVVIPKPRRQRKQRAIATT